MRDTACRDRCCDQRQPVAPAQCDGNGHQECPAITTRPPLTARQIDKRRFGIPLPVLRAMAPDEREAVKRLAIYLVRNRAREAKS